MPTRAMYRLDRIIWVTKNMKNAIIPNWTRAGTVKDTDVFSYCVTEYLSNNMKWQFLQTYILKQVCKF